MADDTTPSGGVPNTGAPMTESAAAAALAALRTKPPAQQPDADADADPTPDSEPADEADSDAGGDQPPADEGEGTPSADAEPAEPAAVDVQALSKILGIPSEDIHVEDDGSISLKTKVDGQDGKVKLNDWRKSYQLDASHTQKSQQFAEERRTFQEASEKAAQALLGREEELQGALRLAAQVLHGQYANVDWAKLKAENPLEFVVLKDNFEAQQQQLAQAWATLTKGQKEKQDKLKADYDAWAKQQAVELVNHVPEWKDPKVAQEALNGIFGTAKAEYGITDVELNQLLDNRYIRILRDAAEYRKLKSKQPGVMQKVRTAPAVAKPGTPQGNKNPVAAAQAAFRANPSDDNAAALMAAKRAAARRRA